MAPTAPMRPLRSSRRRPSPTRSHRLPYTQLSINPYTDAVLLDLAILLIKGIISLSLSLPLPFSPLR